MLWGIKKAEHRLNDKRETESHSRLLEHRLEYIL